MNAPTRTRPARTESRPKIARSNSVRPAPTRPAMPRISPRCSVNVAAARHRTPSTSSSASPACRGVRGKRSSTSRPTISRTISSGVIVAGPPPTTRPSRKHDDAIADLADLVDEVGDVDDRVAARLEPRDQREQALGVAAAERAGRLVEHEHAATDGDGPRDLDELLIGDGKIARPGVRAEMSGRPSSASAAARGRAHARRDRARPTAPVPCRA